MFVYPRLNANPNGRESLTLPERGNQEADGIASQKRVQHRESRPTAAPTERPINRVLEAKLGRGRLRKGVIGGPARKNHSTVIFLVHGEAHVEHAKPAAPGPPRVLRNAPEVFAAHNLRKAGVGELLDGPAFPFDHHPTTTHLLRHRARGAGASKAI